MKHSSEKTMCVMGIDVAKDKLDIFCQYSGEHVIIKNDEKSIRTYIKKTCKDKIINRVVLESTGGYEALAHKLFTGTGYSVHIASPLKAHYFAKQKGYFAKTDKIDAKMLAEYGEQKALINCMPLTAEDKELKELSSRRGQLVEQLTQEKFRLKKHLTTVTKRSLTRTIKSITKEIELVEREINKRIQNNKEKMQIKQRLITFKGVGEKCANAFICGLPELGSLNRAEIASLVGVAPKNHDSGTKSGKRKICGGRFYVRKMLYMAAVVAARCEGPMKVLYQRLKAAGKHSKVALTAIMRKIIITLNAMIRDKKDWCPIQR